MNPALHYAAVKGLDLTTFVASAQVLNVNGEWSVLEWDTAVLGPRPSAADLAAVAAMPDPAPTVAGLLAYAAAKRYAAETAGISVNGATIATDRTSQAMIGNAYAYVQASGAASVSYKTASGFVSLTADQLKALALAVGAHVQACFAVEAQVSAEISASPAAITTYAQIDSAFAGMIPAA